MRVAVLGAGAWGTVLAARLAARADTRLWAREPEVVASIRTEHENRLFLDGVGLPATLVATGDQAEALEDAELVVVAVPAQFLRAAVASAAPWVPPTALVVTVAKGLERGTSRRMSEVLAEVLVGHDPATIGVLSGPNLAREIAAGQPAATCVAFPDLTNARAVQSLLTGDDLRVYTNDDVVGCELGGAGKNVIAIAAGVADGAGYGMNTKAALITRGLAELTRLGIALGGDALTFIGLACNGDLIATCASAQSRNRRVGEELASGRSLDEIVGGMRQVAEGVATAPALVAMATSVGVELPIAATVASLLAGDLAVSDMVPTLMRRAPKHELDGVRVVPST